MAEKRDPSDDRVKCGDCARAHRYQVRGRKVVACPVWQDKDAKGERRPLEVIPSLPLRCFFFRPMREAEDQRTGRERYGCTDQEYSEAYKRRVTVWWLCENMVLPATKRRA